MKELSIEEKAKRYDEAIERIENIKTGKCETTFMFTEGLFEHIFPELAESDDERIRKAMIDFFKHEREEGITVLHYGVNIECMIAWLEKQGEQNHKIIKGKNYFCVKTHNYAGVGWIKDIKYYASDNYTLVNQGCEYYCPEYSKEEHNNLFEEVKYDGCVEKQNEQNPAWSEEDEKMYQSIMDDTVQENQLNDKQTNWLRDIKYRYFPQPKQEWSEEDYNEIETIACHLDNIGNEAMAESLLNIMDKYKSLRPQKQWKPSDEQMRVLDLAIRCGINRGTTEETTLVSLFNDLKKLKG